MERRKLLKLGLSAGVLVTGGALGGWLSSGEGSSGATSGWVRATLDGLEGRGLDRLQVAGVWTAGQIFVHLAQSIEYSMSGYPELKPALFRATAGSAAYAVFSLRGELMHGLDEPIPGAPALPDDPPPAAALARLRAAVDAFDGHTGALAPHFAYGQLSHADYEVAHALHLKDHLEDFGAMG